MNPDELIQHLISTGQTLAEVRATALYWARLFREKDLDGASYFELRTLASIERILR